MTQPLVTLPLVEQFQYGLDAPICLTWELTYACNLSCVHCLSSSGRRDPRELTTAECRAVIDELERMQVFYVNIGGGRSWTGSARRTGCRHRSVPRSGRSARPARTGTAPPAGGS
jgi:hypothetical protein